MSSGEVCHPSVLATPGYLFSALESFYQAEHGAPTTRLSRANVRQDSMKMTRLVSIFTSISFQIEAMLQRGACVLFLLLTGEVGIDPVYESWRGGFRSIDAVEISRGFGRTDLL